MGLGGDLLWTPTLRALHERNGRSVLVCDRPRLSDALTGARFDRTNARKRSPVFENNCHVRFPATIGKSAVARFIDRIGEVMIGFNRLKPWWESRCHAYSRATGYDTLYMDLPQHSYVARLCHGSCEWKPGGHIIDILSASVGLRPQPHRCELTVTVDDERQSASLYDDRIGRPYIVVEPNTNRDCFGDLRSWPFDRWQTVVDWISRVHPELAVAQIGVRGARSLKGCIDLCGLTTFRQAAVLIRNSKLFIGTEGGPMHAANAVQARALILWGGLTEPTFAGYPEEARILHVKTDCTPCGRLGTCDHDHRCMRGITVEWVQEAVHEMLREPALCGIACLP